jgi:hypothetical protein
MCAKMAYYSCRLTKPKPKRSIYMTCSTGSGRDLIVILEIKTKTNTTRIKYAHDWCRHHRKTRSDKTPAERHHLPGDVPSECGEMPWVCR